MPRSLPALARAQTLSARAARLGYEDDADLAAGLAQCLAQLEKELLPRDATGREEVLGGALLALAHLARRLEVDAESALRSAATRFAGRFANREKTTNKGGMT